MIPPTRYMSGYSVSHSPMRPSMVRFLGSQATPKTPEEIKEDLELEKEMQAWQKEKAIRAAKKKRATERKARYYYKDAGFWENLKNCHKAGYISPLPMYRRPLAFLSFDNLKHGWQRSEKLFKKQKSWMKPVAVIAILADLMLSVLTHGIFPLLYILLPGILGCPWTKKFVKAVQEHEADRLRK